jgi:predicted patatin/cPLA2 family phospholipase
MAQFASVLASLLVLLFSVGCASLPRNPVPLESQLSAQIPGMQDVRAVSGQYSSAFEKDVFATEQQFRDFKGLSPADELSVSMLILSGGADYGAFGAGLLTGWTHSGNRPEFVLVTGVSTGALIAPFAFVGSDYDHVLEDAYTTATADDVYRPRWISFLWKDALLDTAPLARLVERHVTQALLNKVARAHQQGRRLWIATTNLDADRLVIWNMGAIAQSRHAGALGLFRKVMLASSSIPGVFPPVMIEVEADGQIYDEMHVDGGVKAQLFVNAEVLNLAAMRQKYGASASTFRKIRRTLYVVRNAKVGPDPEQVERKLSAITGKAMTSLLNSMARSDIERIYKISQEAPNAEFYWISLPIEYIPESLKPFDPVTMRKLYEIGYELGLSGDAWRNHPPGLGQH